MLLARHQRPLFLLFYRRVSVARVTRPSGTEPELVLASVWLQNGIRGTLGLNPWLGGCRVLGGSAALSPGGLEVHLALPPSPHPHVLCLTWASSGWTWPQLSASGPPAGVRAAWIDEGSVRTWRPACLDPLKAGGEEPVSPERPLPHITHGPGAWPGPWPEPRSCPGCIAPRQPFRPQHPGACGVCGGVMPAAARGPWRRVSG